MSLQNQTYREFKTIVVDHGSADGTSEFIQAEFPEVILLKGDESMWWTAATNFGVKRALELSTSEDDLILTLNNDLVVRPDYLSELLKIYNSNLKSIIGSTSVHITDNEKINFIGLKWNRYTAKYRIPKIIHENHSDIAVSIDCVQTDLLPGRGTLIPVQAFKKIGLFDDKNFPHYAADEDFSLRCRYNGYKLLVSVKAVVKSHVDASGTHITMKKRGISSFLRSLKAINSANKISVRYRWAKKHSPLPIVYLLFDISRISYSYFLKK